MIRWLGLLLVLMGCGWTARAETRLHPLFTDHMVLQQNSKAPVWGWAKPGEKITVKGSWSAKATGSVKADESGKWKVILPTNKAGGPYKVEVQGENLITLNDVMLGEVWICSGQSNMAWPLGIHQGLTPVDNAEQEVANANYPNIRLYIVERVAKDEPQETCAGNWQMCDSKSVHNFSAVAYFFGRHLNQTLNVPVGLIMTAWGGTPVEHWTSERALMSHPELQAGVMKRKAQPTDQFGQKHSVLYNGMIAPLIPYAIRGAIWYQGESNVGRAYQYRSAFPLMIQNWRDDWKQGDFPFYFVQIAPFSGYGGQGLSAELREAQMMTLSMKNTGMVVVTDLTPNLGDIHPSAKQDVGKRLALWALAKTYGKKVTYSGPLYRSMKIEGNKIRLFFDHVDGGLVLKGDALTEFQIAGSDQQFHPATAVIEGRTVVVYSDKVPNPAAVRFGWGDASVPNLFNRAGLPASPFRTDQWLGKTVSVKW